MADFSSDLPSENIQDSRDRVLGMAPLQYPSEDLPYFTMIKFVTFNRTNPKLAGLRVDQADVVLPLPMNLREYYQIHYAEVDFSVLGGIDEVGTGLFRQYAETGSMPQEMWDSLGKNTVGLTQAMARKTLGFVSDGASLLDRIRSDIVNPHITSVFRGVSPRDHTLSWRLSATTAQESRTLSQIKDLFRDRMHPTKKDAFLLNFPDEVYVQFMAGNRQFLYPIFKAVLVGFEAPRSSDGTNAFFAGTDEPVITEFHLHLREVESATRETFTEVGAFPTSNTGGQLPPTVPTGPGGTIPGGGVT
jgi:hypothetical protein